jgi:glycosyltransferase involved in cell wall biosynthesis
VRILVVCHPPLSPRFGAAQAALNLAAALAERGHDAQAWSPEPLPAGTRWWSRWRRQRQALERFLERAGPFDVIDAPAISLSPRVARAGLAVARSVQPELLYLGNELRAQLRPGSGTSLPRVLAHAAAGSLAGAANLAGWRRARLIYCLGNHEVAWMRRRFAFWSGKLRRWVVAPSAADQAAFAKVRRRPTVPSGNPGGVRFLWLGRWASHKGTGRLVDFLRERAARRPLDTFTLAGVGPEAARDCPEALVDSGQIRIVPSYRRDELPGLLAAHDAGLFTSDVEGWGLTLNEMLESGLPVYATPAGGVDDLRPFWGDRLQPFPPPLDAVPPARPAPEPAEYLAELTWPAIARRYEEDLLAVTGGAPRRDERS